MRVETAFVSAQARVDTTAQIWDHAKIREGAQIGQRVIVGQGAYIGPGVQIGADSKVQNLAQIYEPAKIGSGVFIGPSVILTNDREPRAVNPDFVQKTSSDWIPVGVTVLDGASIGAAAVCVAPVTIGRWAMVAAGSVVVGDVPDFALVVGNPARQVGWVGRSGKRLVQVDEGAMNWRCPQTNEKYSKTDQGVLILEGESRE